MSQVADQVGSVGGQGLGTILNVLDMALAAKHGSFGNALVQRQAMLQDPDTRANIEHSPIMAGFLGQYGGMQPTAVDTEPGGPSQGTRQMRFQANLPPLGRAAQLKLESQDTENQLRQANIYKLISGDPITDAKNLAQTDLAKARTLKLGQPTPVKGLVTDQDRFRAVEAEKRARLRGSSGGGKPSATEVQAIGTLKFFQDRIATLEKEFSPAERVQYTGILNMTKNRGRQIASGLAPSIASDPKFARFRALLGEMRAYAFGEGGKQLTKQELEVVTAYIPQGNELGGPQEFEQKLANFKERTAALLAARLGQRDVAGVPNTTAPSPRGQTNTSDIERGLMQDYLGQ